MDRARSRSQQRRLAARVAFDMILRNEAYSNLVELAFPHHVRLSIHAHASFVRDDAIALVHQTSRGYPRVVNNLALSALLAALAANKTIVDESSARTALAELTATD